MVRCRKQPVGWIFVSRMIGILFLLILIVVANILGTVLTNPVVKDAVSFLNSNFWLLMLIAAIILVGDLFSALPFPLNLPSPIIKAVGSVFGFAFLLRVFQWMDSITATNVYQAFLPLSFLIIPLVFLIVLACGYYEILRQLWWVPRVEQGGDTQVVHAAPAVAQPERITDVKSWQEIGAEFRLMLFDLLHRFREEINKK